MSLGITLETWECVSVKRLSCQRSLSGPTSIKKLATVQTSTEHLQSLRKKTRFEKHRKKKLHSEIKEKMKKNLVTLEKNCNKSMIEYVHFDVLPWDFRNIFFFFPVCLLILKRVCDMVC
ncbi:unnamed protein product [Larinioides sclopetarius]|uniref:Uncharacterized protein n=1 Tax=Larinioides sclopetarius TaxID=280406 RepID=A0AAV1ZDQ6_9ARAC